MVAATICLSMLVLILSAEVKSIIRTIAEARDPWTDAEGTELEEHDPHGWTEMEMKEKDDGQG